MTYKYPKLMKIVSEIADRGLSEIELLKVEAACVEIEKEELRRMMQMAEKVLGEAPTKRK